MISLLDNFIYVYELQHILRKVHLAFDILILSTTPQQ